MNKLSSELVLHINGEDEDYVDVNTVCDYKTVKCKCVSSLYRAAQQKEMTSWKSDTNSNES